MYGGHIPPWDPENGVRPKKRNWSDLGLNTLRWTSGRGGDFYPSSFGAEGRVHWMEPQPWGAYLNAINTLMNHGTESVPVAARSNLANMNWTTWEEFITEIHNNPLGVEATHVYSETKLCKTQGFQKSYQDSFDLTLTTLLFWNVSSSCLNFQPIGLTISVRIGACSKFTTTRDHKKC